MAFNITSWSRRGRDFARGEPPPRGSIEYVGVGDMWQAAPPPRRAPAPAPIPRPISPPPKPTVSAPAARASSPVPYLVLGGAAYLGISYLRYRLRRPPSAAAVAVPDAHQEDPE